jgi:predicted RNA-binding protein with PIN domain
VLLIDGYNVLQTTGVLPPELAGPEVPDLVRMIAHSRYADREVTVVCDGTGTRSKGVSFGDARVLFSGAHREADDLIESLIVRFRRGRTLTVVSSDRRLHRAARRSKVGVISSASFLAHLASDHRRWRAGRADPGSVWTPRKQVPLSPYSVAMWLDEFGVDAEPAHTDSGTLDSPTVDTSLRDADMGSSEPSAPRSTRPRRRDRTAGTLGEALRVPSVPDVTRAPPSAALVPTPPATPEAVGPPDPPSEPAPVVDEDLLRALQEWRDVVHPDDLDMSKWITDIEPI